MVRIDKSTVGPILTSGKLFFKRKVPYRQSNSKKFAFTLIELIFAIIIISIAVVSLPVMSKITEKGIESNILQEAIFAGSAELMGASSGYWDTNSMDDVAFSHMSRVIDVNSTCENNTSSPRNRLRPGHIAQPLHRRCIDANITATGVSDSNATVFPSLNTAAHANNNVIFTDNSTEASGYKDTYRSTLLVNTSNNVKILTVQVTDNTGNAITVLRMESANIGEIDYFKRRF